MSEIKGKISDAVLAYNKTNWYIVAQGWAASEKKCDIEISVKNETHIEEMEEEILRLLAQDEERVAMVIPYNEGEVYNTLKQRVHIIEESFPEDGIHLIVEVTSYYKNKYAKYIKMPEN